MSIGQEVQVEVGPLAAGGDAAARQQGGGVEDGRVVFVPLAAPGDRARVRIERERRRVAFGELVALERPSPVRVEPACPLFGRCGGCHWQHVSDEAQRQAKGAIAGRALFGPPPAGSAAGARATPALAAGPAYGYRDRARFSVAASGASAGEPPAIGFHARRSHDVVDVPACPLLSPEAAAALPALRERFRPAPPGTGITLQAGRDGQVAVAAGGRLFTLERDRQGGAASLVERDPAQPSWWPDVAEPGGRPLRLPPGAFAQVGRWANAALMAAVAEALGPRPGTVLELHAGSGTFTRLLVARAAQVIASDGEPAALERGRRNVPEAEWRAWSTLAQLAAAAPAPAAQTVLVDPPREGLDAASLALAGSAGERLVYVSCDPQTLGRDVGRLAARGLRLEGAQILDLMPQTHHVEVVAVFTRADEIGG